MTLWYDASDLTTWTLPHLTGIQRTTVGILNGLVADGTVPRLVRFDSSSQAFVPIAATELPEAVQRHLPWLATAPATVTGPAAALPATQPAAPTPRRKRRFIHRDTVLGTSPAASDLRQSFREFKAAARKMRKLLARWTAVRFAEITPALRGSPSRFGAKTVPRPLPHAAGALGCFSEGDLLLSVGATWPIAGHAEAAAGLRRAGVRVMRMVYDLIPTIKPQWVDQPTVRQVTTWVRRVLTESDHVFTISEFSRQEIEAYCTENGFARPSTSGRTTASSTTPGACWHPVIRMAAPTLSVSGCPTSTSPTCYGRFGTTGT